MSISSDNAIYSRTNSRIKRTTEGEHVHIAKYSLDITAQARRRITHTDGKGVLGIEMEMGGSKNVKNKDACLSNEAATMGKYVAGSSSLTNDDIVCRNKEDTGFIVANIGDIKRQILKGKFLLVGDNVIPLKPLNVDGQDYAMDSFPCLSNTCGTPNTTTKVDTDGISDTASNNMDDGMFLLPLDTPFHSLDTLFFVLSIDREIHIAK
ncbi:hypothetical protein Tco_1098565 [Tanacetum coccineum]